MDTEAIQTVQATKSNEDKKISVEEDASYNFSRTRKFPVVPLIQAVEISYSDYNNEDIHITRDDPNVSFDSESNTDDGEIDVLGNISNIQDAFIF